MKRSDLLAFLRSQSDVLKNKFGIKKIALFGSYARNEASDNSDIDIAILEIEEKDYFKRVAAKYYLENMLKRKVDIGYFDSIRPVIRNQIKKEMIRV